MSIFWVIMIFILFFKNDIQSFIQIDRVNRYNTNLKSLKTKMMNLRTKS